MSLRDHTSQKFSYEYVLMFLILLFAHGGCRGVGYVSYCEISRHWDFRCMSYLSSQCKRRFVAFVFSAMNRCGFNFVSEVYHTHSGPPLLYDLLLRWVCVFWVSLVTLKPLCRNQNTYWLIYTCTHQSFYDKSIGNFRGPENLSMKRFGGPLVVGFLNPSCPRCI